MTEPLKPNTHDVQRGANRFRIAASLLFLGQIVLICVLQFGDFGFDHPGRFGLDFDDFLLIGLMYAIVLVAGLAYSLIKRHWIFAVVQICIPVALVGYTFRPYPRYDAAQYQYLKGKSKSEVQGILGTRGAVTGREGHPDGDREFAHYRGMTVIYSSKGQVMAVISDHD